MSGYLLVRADSTWYGLPIQDVVEVVDDILAEPVPGAGPAVRGVSRIRGRLLPTVHLGALLSGVGASAPPSGTVVVARCLANSVAFEVDDAVAVVRSEALPVPAGQQFPCAAAIAHHDDRLVPILDLAAVGERLAALENRETA